MNVITDIGNFLIAYAPYVETALIILAAIIAVVVVVLLVKGAGDKKKILTDISDNVEKINTAVNRINDKSKDVIYIDNRPQVKEEKDVKPVSPENMEPADMEDITEITEHLLNDEEPVVFEKEMPEEKKEAPKKFTTRDCAVSKQGREYTLEELIEQIKK